MVQQHLTFQEMTDYGCYYTPQAYVDRLINMVKKHVTDYSRYIYLDSSCGYGTFLKSLFPLRTIGCDIDEKAIEIAKRNFGSCQYYHLNSLFQFRRESISLSSEDRLIIIGNPPYNDTTSKVKSDIKKAEPCEIDEDIKTRDLGISFLLSYNKLQCDYVAVLHPLSYMIKKANYKLLEPFYKNYRLIDHCIVNSQTFRMTSKTKGFPIIIALYQKNNFGTPYDEIMKMRFQTIENQTFCLAHDSIGNYISKYPSKYKEHRANDILFFTMRDINALNRSRTFIQELSENSIIINKSKFPYYCYVDVFKDYIIQLPYYYGNCDVFINNLEFCKIKNIFITKSMEKHPWLKEKIFFSDFDDRYELIDEYFKKLFDL